MPPSAPVRRDSESPSEDGGSHDSMLLSATTLPSVLVRRDMFGLAKDKELLDGTAPNFIFERRPKNDIDLAVDNVSFDSDSVLPPCEKVGVAAHDTVASRRHSWTIETVNGTTWAGAWDYISSETCNAQLFWFKRLICVERRRGELSNTHGQQGGELACTTPWRLSM